MISGNSWLPTFKAISDGEIVDTATGVDLIFAISITPEVTTTSPNTFISGAKEATKSSFAER